jgi:hypothetical protein
MPVTPAQFGQTFTEGIKYIKLNKLDKNGLDNSNRLQQADSIIINYPDIGPQEYIIASTTPQQDYYLLGLVNNPNTSSLNEVLDYSVEAIRSPVSFTVNNTPINLSSSIPVWSTVNGNSLGYFISTGESKSSYVFGNTPNTPLHLSFSGSYGSATDNLTFKIAIVNTGSNNFSDNYIDIVSSSLTSGTGTFLIPYTMSQGFAIEDNSISFDLFVEESGESFTVTSFFLRVTSSISPIIATSSLVIFTPEEDFYYSDYNALFGNAEIPQFSNHFMDVDYTSDFTTPVNFDLIISGTADRAQISDSNYSSFAWSNIRYRGSKYNSYKI